MKSFKVYIKESLLDNEDDLATDFTKEIEDFITKIFRCPGYKIKRDANGDYIVNCDTVSSKYWETETLTNGLFKWGVVKDFLIDGLWKLKSLEGAPMECKEFICAECNSLESFKGAPRKCVRFDCSACKSLESFEGTLQECEELYCPMCRNLKSFDGLPKDINDILNIRGCKKLLGLPLPQINGKIWK